MRGQGRQLWLGPDAGCVLLFVPGFMAPVTAYRELLEPLTDLAVQVGVLGFVPPGLGALVGRTSPQQEAARVAEVAGRIVAEGRELWLAGHSRGGQIAWRVAEAVEPTGLVVVDPVDGTGPRSSPEVTRRPPSFAVRPLIISLGEPSRCAPADLGPEQFARAAPSADLVVVPDAGHADICSGRTLAWGRRLCRAGADPAAVRRQVTDLVVAALGGVSRS